MSDLRVLLVDDNKSITDMLSKYLSLQHIECIVSNNGNNALTLIRTEKWNTIILDISMPEFSGIDVVDALEQDGVLKDLKIVLFTASSIGHDEIERLLKRGVYACIKKPVQLSELIQLIK